MMVLDEDSVTRRWRGRRHGTAVPIGINRSSKWMSRTFVASKKLRPGLIYVVKTMHRAVV